MKILLISPPVCDFFFTPQRAYPLGLLSLATTLDKAGFNAKILNCLEDYKKQTIKLPSEFSYLKEYYQPNLSPFRLFSNYYRFGLSDEQIKMAVKNFSPDIVGISSNFSAYFDSALSLARLIKQIDQRIVVVFGGRVPTAQPKLPLGKDYVDFVLRGEAEFSLLKLAKGIKEGKIPKVEGLCYKRADKKIVISKDIAIIGDLNCLPILNRRLIDYRKYRFKEFISTSMLTSRGCNLRCAFCAIDEPFRWRKAENILEEIEDCFSLGIRHFNFEDDNINLHPEFEKILDRITEKFKERVKISFMNGLLSLGINKRLREKLIDAGITHLDLSLVSSDKKLRKNLCRKENAKSIFELANFMAERKVETTIHFIVGFPGQKFIDAIKDLRVLSARRTMLGPSIFYPVIAGRLFESLKEEPSLKEGDYKFFRSSTACFDKSISRGRIFSIFYFSRIINFIKKLIDTSAVDTRNILGVFQNKARKFQIRGNTLFSKVKLDKITLGMILLEKLISQRRLYRVQKIIKGNAYQYTFIEEEFVKPNDTKRLLSGLTIKGISGETVRIPRDFYFLRNSL